jgi:hypothetical protein
MTQEMIEQRKPWALVSVLKPDANPQDAENLMTELGVFVDDWHSHGKLMWSGAFDDDKTSMTVFEATENEANEFFTKYDNICNKAVASYIYQWDAMPILSLLSKN